MQRGKKEEKIRAPLERPLLCAKRASSRISIVDMAADDAEEPHVRVQFPLDLHKDGLLLSKHLAEIRLICISEVGKSPWSLSL